MNDAGLVDEKAALRRRIRADRAAEDERAREEKALRFRSAAGAVARVAGSGVAGFQPTNAEPDVSGLLRDLLAETGVLLPRVRGLDLEWVSARTIDLVGGLTGIPRPTGKAVAVGVEVASLVGLILVPALAVDPRNGARLGYGQGFYDRLLHDLRALPSSPPAVGVCRSKDLVAVPAQAHDQAIDAVLTENGLCWIGRQP